MLAKIGKLSRVFIHPLFKGVITMDYIWNLTQHSPTAAQAAEGVQQPLEGAAKLLTFDQLPSQLEISARVLMLATLVAQNALLGDKVMVGGAPYLMGPLVSALKEIGLRPVFSFTERRSVEKTLEDGSVSKTAIFEHVGWVEG